MNNNNQETNKSTTPKVPELPDDLLVLVKKDDKDLEKEKEKELSELPTAETNINFERNEEKEKEFDSFLMKKVKNPKIEKEKKTKKENKIFMYITICLGVVFLLILMFTIFNKKGVFSFIGGDPYYENSEEDLSLHADKDGEVHKIMTSVYANNVYKRVNVSNENDAKKLIVKDANNQKSKTNCKTNEEVAKIETEIETKYNIPAVNFCEMNINRAKKIQKVIDDMYVMYPEIKGYITNISLINVPNDAPNNYIATFSAVRIFAKSKGLSGLPQVYKMGIYLNAADYLDDTELDNTPYHDEDGTEHIQFIPNSTYETLVSHEFGHYISFLAHIKHYSQKRNIIVPNRKILKSYGNVSSIYDTGDFSLKMVKEAYNNYKKKTDNPKSFDDWRHISDYAADVTIDENIAESFHDVYVNKDNANEASKEIVKVVLKYLKK